LLDEAHDALLLLAGKFPALPIFRQHLVELVGDHRHLVGSEALLLRDETEGLEEQLLRVRGHADGLQPAVGGFGRTAPTSLATGSLSRSLLDTVQVYGDRLTVYRRV